MSTKLRFLFGYYQHALFDRPRPMKVRVEGDVTVGGDVKLKPVTEITEEQFNGCTLDQLMKMFPLEAA